MSHVDKTNIGYKRGKNCDPAIQSCSRSSNGNSQAEYQNHTLRICTNRHTPRGRGRYRGSITSNERTRQAHGSNIQNHHACMLNTESGNVHKKIRQDRQATLAHHNSSTVGATSASSQPTIAAGRGRNDGRTTRNSGDIATAKRQR